MFSAHELRSMLDEAKCIAKETGEIWCKEIYNCCNSICFCTELESNWENISSYPLPYLLQRDRNNRLQAQSQSAPASTSLQSGVYLSKVSQLPESFKNCMQSSVIRRRTTTFITVTCVFFTILAVLQFCLRKPCQGP